MSTSITEHFRAPSRIQVDGVGGWFSLASSSSLAGMSPVRVAARRPVADWWLGADSIKAGDWAERTERLSVGQESAVVVLDDRQDPVRASALHADIEAARAILANRPANGDL
jgi:hypothetical protein